MAPDPAPNTKCNRIKFDRCEMYHADVKAVGNDHDYVCPVRVHCVETRERRSLISSYCNS